MCDYDNMLQKATAEVVTLNAEFEAQRLKTTPILNDLASAYSNVVLVLGENPTTKTQLKDFRSKMEAVQLHMISREAALSAWICKRDETVILQQRREEENLVKSRNMQTMLQQQVQQLKDTLHTETQKVLPLPTYSTHEKDNEISRLKDLIKGLQGAITPVLKALRCMFDSIRQDVGQARAIQKAQEPQLFSLLSEKLKRRTSRQAITTKRDTLTQTDIAPMKVQCMPLAVSHGVQAISVPLTMTTSVSTQSTGKKRPPAGACRPAHGVVERHVAHGATIPIRLEAICTDALRLWVRTVFWAAFYKHCLRTAARDRAMGFVSPNPHSFTQAQIQRWEHRYEIC